MLALVTILKGLNEIILLTMIGQGALYLLAGRSREQNLIYGVFQIITRPVCRFFRKITPRLVLDHHVPFVAFFWLLLLEVGFIAAKIYLVKFAALPAG